MSQTQSSLAERITAQARAKQQAAEDRYREIVAIMADDREEEIDEAEGLAALSAVGKSSDDLLADAEIFKQRIKDRIIADEENALYGKLRKTMAEHAAAEKEYNQKILDMQKEIRRLSEAGDALRNAVDNCKKARGRLSKTAPASLQTQRQELRAVVNGINKRLQENEASHAEYAQKIPKLQKAVDSRRDVIRGVRPDQKGTAERDLRDSENELQFAQRKLEGSAEKIANLKQQHAAALKELQEIEADMLLV